MIFMAMALTRTRDIFAINPDGLLTAAASRKIVKYAAGYSETRGTACPSCQGFYQRRVIFTASYCAFYITWPIPRHLHTEKHLVIAHLGMHLLCCVGQLPSMCSIFRMTLELVYLLIRPSPSSYVLLARVSV